ncbi:MAG: serine hydrolase, partial [Solirubrobacteraceae bacterium]
MELSRRTFLTGATAAAVPLAIPELAAAKQALAPTTILSLFSQLPGRVAVKILAPAVRGGRGLLIESRSSERLFVGSAIKTFVLCEALRQADTPDVVQRISDRQLALDASVWSSDSATFNPPNLIGMVSERTALEAMIMHSDNTATD